MVPTRQDTGWFIFTLHTLYAASMFGQQNFSDMKYELKILPKMHSFFLICHRLPDWEWLRQKWLHLTVSAGFLWRTENADFMMKFPGVFKHIFSTLNIDKKISSPAILQSQSYQVFFLLVSHLRLSQRVDDPTEGWHKLVFIVITLFRQQLFSSFKHLSPC